jgi:hypothetical protein
LVEEFISERENQSLHAKELNTIHESKMYKETTKIEFNFGAKEDETISESK